MANVELSKIAEPAGPAVDTPGEDVLCGRSEQWEPFIQLDDVTVLFVCWPPPQLNVLTL